MRMVITNPLRSNHTPMYHYRPIEESPHDKIKRALNILKSVVDRENKRHMMDQELTYGMMDLLESEAVSYTHLTLPTICSV